MSRPAIVFSVLSVSIMVLFGIDLCHGGADISATQVWQALTGGDCPPSVRTIVVNIRLTKAVVALLAGAALSAAGLEMQTLFRNPLAGPYVLGISSGASLGVALFTLGMPLAGTPAWLTGLGVAGAAWLGSAAVLAVTAAVASRIRDIMVILILGIMFASCISAIVQILQYLGDEDSLKTFVIWTMGSLGDVTAGQLAVVAPAVMAGLVLALVASKPLNLLLFGEDYARTMGLDVKLSRALVFTSTVLLAGTVTAFCGPIGFIGLAMPHVARMAIAESNHRLLMPASMLAGAAVLLLCDIVSKSFTIPVNAITALLGIPIVIWVVLKNR